MPNRTIQFYGTAYAPSPVNLEVTFNGVEVFNGPVTTLNTEAVDRNPDDQVLLYTAEIDSNITGPIPMVVNITNGSAYLMNILANYSLIKNPVYTPEQTDIITDPDIPLSEKLPIYESVANPALSPADIEILETGTREQVNQVLKDHRLLPGISSGPDEFAVFYSEDPRTNVEVTNASYVSPTPPVPRPAGKEGCWGWLVAPMAGQTATITQNIVISPAVL